MTRVLLEVTNLDSGKTRYITVSEHDDADTPALVADYARKYTAALLGLPAGEAVPYSLALFPGGDEEPDDIA